MKSIVPDRNELQQCTVRVIREPERARPDVRVVEAEGRRFVVKDYSPGALPFKRALGAYLVLREKIAYERAQGVAGIPGVAGTLGPCALVIEYIDGCEATSAPEGLLDNTFFERLEDLVQQLHARGVAHGDLKKLENILVTADGRPYLVDFTAAFVTGSSPLAAAVFPSLCDDDIRAVSKLKARCAPHLLSDEERQFLSERSTMEKLFRWSRRYVRYAVKLYSTPKEQRGAVEFK